MTDEREQLERLLACSLDHELTADERLRVQRAMAEDSAAGVLRGEYQRLQGLLDRWRSLPADLDWSSFRQGLSSALKRDASTLEGDENLTAVDDRVRQWAGPMPEVDWSAFQARVSTAVRAEAARSGISERSPYRWPNSVRWFVPMAAAAVIAIAVFRMSGPGPRVLEPGGGPSSLVLVSVDAPEASRGRISIQFDESAPEVEDIDPVRGTAFVQSAAPIGMADGDDEAAYY